MNGPPLVCKLRSSLERAGIGAEGLAVAVSGGPDSVALLRGLLECRRGAGAAGPLLVAHLNHQLRGPDSDADERFVRDLCDALGGQAAELHFHVERVDIAGRARDESDNLEAVARAARYEWLERLARAHGLRWVATGHTADDQAETVLHHVLRGTGLSGLRGIAVRRPLSPGVCVVRPLLAVSRTEVLGFLKARGQAYREDRSNRDPRFTRNRLRHELLPHLARHYNPAIVEVLGRLAEQAEDVVREEEARAAQLLAGAERPRAGSFLVLDRELLVNAPRQLLREAFRLVWVREGWPLREMGFEHWDRLAAVGRGEIPAVDLPGGVRARGRERVVQVGRGE